METTSHIESLEAAQARLEALRIRAMEQIQEVSPVRAYLNELAEREHLNLATNTQ